MSVAYLCTKRSRPANVSVGAFVSRNGPVVFIVFSAVLIVCRGTAGAACTDNGAANFTGVLKPGASVEATSGASYGSPACADHFVVEATGIKGLPKVSAGATWGDKSVPKESCSGALIAASFYGFKPSANSRTGGTWVNLGTRSAAGKAIPFADSFICDLRVGIDVDSSQYTKVRVAAKAGTVLKSVRKLIGTVSSSLPPT